MIFRALLGRFVVFDDCYWYCYIESKTEEKGDIKRGAHLKYEDIKK